MQRSELLVCEGSICIRGIPAVRSQMNGVGLSYLTVVFKTCQVVVEWRLEAPPARI